MKERGFTIADQQEKFVIQGGNLWQMRPRKLGCLAFKDKRLVIGLRPSDNFEIVFTELRNTIRTLSPVLSFRLLTNSLLTPFVLVIPAVILILFIGTVGAYGNLINELLSIGNGPTQLGIDKIQLFCIQTTLYIVGAYAFPLFFQGDYGDTISHFKAITDNEQVMKGRMKKALILLQKRNYLDRVEVWNPNLGAEDNAWIKEILLPAIVDSGIALSLQIKVEEQFVASSLIDKLEKRDLEWHESKAETQPVEAQHIPLEFLEEWEREMLQVLSAASMVFLPDSWKKHLSENPGEGNLEDVVSLPLARAIVGHFHNRLFSNPIVQHETVVNLFAGRCINDYGLLHPLSSHEFDMYRAAAGILEPEMKKLIEERNYILPFLQGNAGVLVEKIPDAAGGVILGGTQATYSIYNESKRQTIEGFIRGVSGKEKFKVLRAFWDLVISEEGLEKNESPEAELYRLLDTEVLRDLVLAFRRAGMYDKTDLCYRFLSAIYPVDSSIGEAVVLSELGDYEASIQKFLETEEKWMGDLSGKGKANQPGAADIHARLSLNLFMCVVIVMNQLKDHKALAEKSLKLIGELLSQMEDGKRNNQQLTRYYNVLASYHEWTDNYSLAVETYEKGLSIPGVDRALISSLMVNKGIAYRFLGKESKEESDIFHYLREGVRTNLEGVEAKEIIGNVDQLPIALHNLAETCIELAHRLPEGPERSSFYQRGWTYSQKGLDINQQINSSKKRGQLLVERFLAGCGHVDAASDANMSQATDELCGWIRENTGKEGYDIDVAIDMLTRIGGFLGNSLEEILPKLGTKG